MSYSDSDFGVTEDERIRDTRRARQNPPMALSNKEKQEAYRARRALLGMTEVRGIYLPPELHAELKAEAAKLLAQHQKSESRKSPAEPSDPQS
jgi:hypothetical protein